MLANFLAHLCCPDGFQIAARLFISLPSPPAALRGCVLHGTLPVTGGSRLRLSSTGSTGALFLGGTDRQRVRDSGGDRGH